jgi:hypothetical protein
VLDFDFEKVCSVSLSPINVYACLVCGKFYQGRTRTSHAVTHSLETDHHVFLNLSNGRCYCLPDDYEIDDSALDDVKVRCFTRLLLRWDRPRDFALPPRRSPRFGVSGLPLAIVGRKCLQRFFYIPFSLEYLVEAVSSIALAWENLIFGPGPRVLFHFAFPQNLEQNHMYCILTLIPHFRPALLGASFDSRRHRLSRQKRNFVPRPGQQAIFMWIGRTQQRESSRSSQRRDPVPRAPFIVSGFLVGQG